MEGEHRSERSSERFSRCLVARTAAPRYKLQLKTVFSAFEMFDLDGRGKAIFSLSFLSPLNWDFHRLRLDPERLYKEKEWWVQVFGKILLTAARVVLACICGEQGCQPLDIAGLPLHQNSGYLQYFEYV